MHDFLLECKQITAQHAEARKNRRRTYNIYQLLDITDKEIQMCRILADLLDPDGVHDEGIKYLKVFFDTVLHIDLPDSVLRGAKVEREYPIINKRRIDIVIDYQGGFIPIEVKINAEDMKSQCYDYYHFARKTDPDTFVVYLTRNGCMPSAYSLTGEKGDRLDEKYIHCISFEGDILSWLDKIKRIADENMVPMLEQFEGAVLDFLYSEGESYKMDLSEKILESSSNLRTAIAIADSLNFAKAELMKRLFQEFENQMEPLLKKYNLEPEMKSKWYHYKDMATEDYYAYKRNTTYPGLNYVISSVNLGGGLSLWLRIEIEYRLLGSLCVFNYAANSDNGYEIGNQCDDISDALWKKLRGIILLPEEKSNDGWSIIWRFLPTGTDIPRGTNEKVPDFKVMNEAAIELADDDKRKEFVARSIKVIEEKLLSLIKT
ncbi:MAG TPA: hypothetical protein DCP64_14935 [Sarcina sp.]|nr:hypothetical protein [Sarcina sp.]